MSPEQVSGDQVVDHRADVYSLGTTLYELLTTQQAFPGEDRHQLAQAVLNDEPIDPQIHEPNLPSDLKTIIGKAMRKDPADRYQSAAALVDDLQRFVNHRPIQARPVARIERISKFARRNPLLASLALSTLMLLAVLSLGSVGLAWKSSSDARRQRALRDREEQAVYAGDMRLARIALDEGDLISAESWLLKWAPTKGIEAEHDLRGFEWYHLWDRCNDTTIEHTFSHMLKAGYLSFSPDGRKLFDGFFSRDIPIWDLNEQSKLWKKLPIMRRFRPLHKQLATGCLSATLMAT